MHALAAFCFSQLNRCFVLISQTIHQLNGSDIVFFLVFSSLQVLGVIVEGGVLCVCAPCVQEHALCWASKCYVLILSWKQNLYQVLTSTWMNAPGLPHRLQSGFFSWSVYCGIASIRFTLFRLCSALVYGRVQPCEWCVMVHLTKSRMGQHVSRMSAVKRCPWRVWKAFRETCLQCFVGQSVCSSTRD